MIFVIDDNLEMAECVARATKANDVRIFGNGIEAMEAFSEVTPDLIFLDILLDGPDGFAFLNEMMSYPDTKQIPVVIVTSLNIDTDGLKQYGVVGVLNKDTMLPQEIYSYAKQYAK